MADFIQWSDKKKRAFQSALLEWFQQNHRDFPWRTRLEPYSILLAEKVLQQTAARDVSINAYETLLTTYPVPSDLAKARAEDLHEVFKPIGLSYRARELPEMARYLIENHAGEVPADLEKLLSIPGVGNYTARAILSFAYEFDVGVVDTNVSRIFYRIFALSGPLPKNPARKKMLLDLSDALVPTGKSRPFNFAILDLGALVCTVRQPLCGECPVSRFCIHAQVNQF